MGRGVASRASNDGRYRCAICSQSPAFHELRRPSLPCVPSSHFIQDICNTMWAYATTDARHPKFMEMCERTLLERSFPLEQTHTTQLQQWLIWYERRTHGSHSHTVPHSPAAPALHSPAAPVQHSPLAPACTLLTAARVHSLCTTLSGAGGSGRWVGAPSWTQPYASSAETP